MLVRKGFFKYMVADGFAVQCGGVFQALVLLGGDFDGKAHNVIPPSLFLPGCLAVTQGTYTVGIVTVGFGIWYLVSGIGTWH